MSVMLLVLGLFMLAVGGEVLVRYATQLGLALHVPPLVIGLTVVAFGTSSPELAASMAAALRGAPEIAIGNVIGSNVANVALVLGMSGLLSTVAIDRDVRRRDLPVLLLATLVASAMIWRGEISRAGGALLVALLASYLLFLLRRGGHSVPSLPTEESAATPSLGPAILGVVAGLVLLSVGGPLTVEGATRLATQFGVSERVIALTIVAIGSSLPEIAVTIVAAVRRQADLVLGNIVGSNIFNLLAILGSVALVRPLVPGNPAIFHLDVIVMVATTVLLAVILLLATRVGRPQGGTLMASYITYLVSLIVF